MHSTERDVAPNSTYYVYTPSTLARSIFLYPLIVGLFRYQPGYHLDRTAFDSFLIMHIRAGECNVKANDRIFKAKAGQTVFLNCYEPHSYWTDTGYEAQWIHFDGSGAMGYFQAVVNRGNPVVTLSDSERLEKYLDKLYLYFHTRTPVKEAILNNYIVNILTEFFDGREGTCFESDSLNVIGDIVAYINEHMAEPLHLEELARQAALSPFYFSRLFKKETGFSPHEYIVAVRINYAKYLLKSTDRAIKNICFCTGFSSESSFCTAFKKSTGFTPMEYRLGDER